MVRFASCSASLARGAEPWRIRAESSSKSSEMPNSPHRGSADLVLAELYQEGYTKKQDPQVRAVAVFAARSRSLHRSANRQDALQ